MEKRSEQVHSRESSATLQLTVSLLYPPLQILLPVSKVFAIINIILYYVYRIFFCSDQRKDIYTWQVHLLELFLK